MDLNAWMVAEGWAFAYFADWRAHAGASPALKPAPFPFRTQTSADLGAARWGLLAWEAPGAGMPASPFWIDEAMPEGRFVETDDADPKAILVLFEEAGATLAGLRLSDGALVLRIARGRKSGQVRIPDLPHSAYNGRAPERLWCRAPWRRVHRAPRESSWLLPDGQQGRPNEGRHSFRDRRRSRFHWKPSRHARTARSCAGGHVRGRVQFCVSERRGCPAH